MSTREPSCVLPATSDSGLSSHSLYGGETSGGVNDASASSTLGEEGSTPRHDDCDAATITTTVTANSLVLDDEPPSTSPPSTSQGELPSTGSQVTASTTSKSPRTRLRSYTSRSGCHYGNSSMKGSGTSATAQDYVDVVVRLKPKLKKAPGAHIKFSIEAGHLPPSSPRSTPRTARAPAVLNRSLTSVTSPTSARVGRSGPSTPGRLLGNSMCSSAHLGTLLSITGPSSSSEGAGDETRTYEFNEVFGPDVSDVDLCAGVVSGIVDQLLAGYNACLLCYGQTGSGKTHTINVLAPALIHAIFEAIDTSNDIVEVSFIQLYNDRAYNLLGKFTEKDNLGAPLPKPQGTFVCEPKYLVRNADELVEKIKAAQKFRFTSSHSLNARSSRSHTLLSIHVTKCVDGAPLVTTKATLADLAGSERVKKTGAAGEGLGEAIAINKSLLALRSMISSAADSTDILRYRENLLTLYLAPRLKDWHLVLIVTASLERSDFSETKTSLDFATTAKGCLVAKKKSHTADYGPGSVNGCGESAVAEARAKLVTVIETLRHRVESLQEELAIERERSELEARQAIAQQEAPAALLQQQQIGMATSTVCDAAVPSVSTSPLLREPSSAFVGTSTASAAAPSGSGMQGNAGGDASDGVAKCRGDSAGHAGRCDSEPIGDTSKGPVVPSPTDAVGAFPSPQSQQQQQRQLEGYDTGSRDPVATGTSTTPITVPATPAMIESGNPLDAMKSSAPGTPALTLEKSAAFSQTQPPSPSVERIRMLEQQCARFQAMLRDREELCTLQAGVEEEVQQYAEIRAAEDDRAQRLLETLRTHNTDGELTEGLSEAFLWAHEQYSAVLEQYKVAERTLDSVRRENRRLEREQMEVRKELARQEAKVASREAKLVQAHAECKRLGQQLDQASLQQYRGDMERAVREESRLLYSGDRGRYEEEQKALQTACEEQRTLSDQLQRRLSELEEDLDNTSHKLEMTEAEMRNRGATLKNIWALLSPQQKARFNDLSMYNHNMSGSSSPASNNGVAAAMAVALNGMGGGAVSSSAANVAGCTSSSTAGVSLSQGYMAVQMRLTLQQLTKNLEQAASTSREKDFTIDTLNNRNEELARQLTDLHERYSALSECNAALEADKIRLGSEVSNACAYIFAYKNNESQLVTWLNTATEEQNTMRQVCREQEDRIEELERELTRARAREEVVISRMNVNGAYGATKGEAHMTGANGITNGAMGGDGGGRTSDDVVLRREKRSSPKQKLQSQPSHSHALLQGDRLEGRRASGGEARKLHLAAIMTANTRVHADDRTGTSSGVGLSPHHNLQASTAARGWTSTTAAEVRCNTGHGVPSAKVKRSTRNGRHDAAADEAPRRNSAGCCSSNGGGADNGVASEPVARNTPDVVKVRRLHK